MAKIEEEIKQQKFRSEYQKLAINILFSSSWLSDLIHQQLKPYGISQQQYNVLRILKGRDPEPCSLKLITERMIDKMSNASRLVTKLEDKGLVSRSRCPENRRQLEIVISEKGKNLLAEVNPLVESHDERFSALTVEEAAKLNELLDKVRD